MNKEEVRKDINTNRNHSWIKEIYLRHKDEMDRKILDYFGNNITYKELFKNASELANAMEANGLKKGDEFLVVTDRIPEYVYLICAANMIGANIHFVSEKFNSDYIKEIIKNTNSNLIFIQDKKIKKLLPILENLKDYNIITFSHKRSLLGIKPFYYYLIDEFYGNNDIDVSPFITYDDFIKSGSTYNRDKLFEEIDLDDAFTVTYSSGTTKKGFPKGIVHTNRHYITMGRYHDPEVSGVPSLKNFSTYSNIPSYSNTYILSSLSDNLIMGGKVILDPIDDPAYFTIGMKIHKSNMNVATPSVWLLNALNFYNSNDKYDIKSLPDALFNFAGGEPLSAGEEKFLNKFLKDLKCGVNITHTPFSLAKMSTAGADCEHGSLFYRLLRGYFNNLPYRIGRKDPIGMKIYDFVDVQVLRPDGTYCNPLEHGQLVANSDCTMKEYKNNPEGTKNFYIKDAYGKTWGTMNMYGYLDEKRYVSMKGRYTNDSSIPVYRIADEILKDTKKIMSCEVVSLKQDDEFIYVAHIMPQYNTTFNKEKVLKGALQRCINEFGDGIQNILYFKIRNSYPLSLSSKRDPIVLKLEGLENTEKIGEKVYEGKSKVKKKNY